MVGDMVEERVLQGWEDRGGLPGTPMRSIGHVDWEINKFKKKERWLSYRRFSYDGRTV